MRARRYPARSRAIEAKVIKPKRGQDLLPVMIVRGLMPNLARVNADFKQRRGPKQNRQELRDRHMAYEVIRLAALAEGMSPAQAIPAAKRAVAHEFGCNVPAVSAALKRYSSEAEENQASYIAELQRQSLLGN